MTIVVVGAGIAGLVAARELAQQGVRVRVLEASDLFGGSLQSASVGPIDVDVGAEAFAVTRPEALDLIDDVGLTHRIVFPRRTDARVLANGSRLALPPALLGIPVDLSSPQLAAIVGKTGVDDAIRRDARPLPTAIDPRITLGQLARDRLGNAVLAGIVAPVVGGVHAIDPDLVEAEAIVPGLLAALRAKGSLAAAALHLRSVSGVPGSAVAGLEGGMTTLITALVADLRHRGVTLQPSTSVSSIRGNLTGWRVVAGREEIDASAVILALGAPSAARLLAEEAPAVSDRLAEISVGDVAVVTAVVSSVELDEDPVGSGVLVCAGTDGVRAKALTHATAKWEWIRRAYGPGRHLVRLSYGRNGRVDEDLAELPKIALADLQRIAGISIGTFDDVRVTTWRQSLVQQRVGHRDNIAALRDAAEACSSLAIAGAGLGGNGIAGTIAQARTVIDQLRDAQLGP